VTNVYDLSSRIFLLKFHKPDHREQLLVDSGFRCHLTEYARTTAAAPSAFVAKLRKYLKTRRVTSIAQIGTDRILEFQFSDGLYRLYMEFYAGGNIVLTDANLNVLSLLRNVDEGEEHERLRVGLQYNLSLRQNYGGAPELTSERVRQGLQKAVDKQKEHPEATGKKAKKAAKDTLRKALATSITECPPLLVDHALHMAGFDSTLKPEQVLGDDKLIEKLLRVLQNAREITEEITTSEQTKGYILAKPNPAATPSQIGSQDGNSNKSQLLYDDFHPFKPQQFEESDYHFLEFDGFNKAVDEFFSSIEGQKLEAKLTEREQQAKKKLEKARKEHEDRIESLQQVQEINFRKAEAILANVHRVSEATEAVNGLIRQGMDWIDIARLIEREQSQGNPVAQSIRLPLKLHENTITLLLGETSWNQGEEEDDLGNETSSISEDSDEGDEGPRKTSASIQITTQQQLAIDIDLGLSAWANSTEYYDQKKSAAGKEDRTAAASSKALKNHEKKVAEDLKKGLKQEREVLRPVRKQQWFEKFIYFVSSDGYLVLGGKDAQQNEIIYKRFLRRGDVYVHADLKGAVPMIIKNQPNTPDAPIPPSTLSQAGHLSVCSSEAWDSKAVMSAWWVRSDQVSKIGQTGEFLAAGLFNITGKKEFLPPAQLVVGLAVMFEISESSKANHQKHRFQATAISAAEMAYEPTKAAINATEENQSTDDKHDEAFPDAKIASDSEDDFPDAKIDHTEESDTDSEPAELRCNPLQSEKILVANDSDDKEDAPTDSKDALIDRQNGPIAMVQDAESAADTEQTPRRHLSARERRLLRKGQQLNGGDGTTGSTPVDADGSMEGDAQAAAKVSGTATSQISKTTTNVIPRGKRGKAKKLAAKYAAQDEEDRALAMRLLGSQSGQKVAEAAAQDKRQKDKQAQADKQRRRDQHFRAQAAGKAAEEARRAAIANTQDEDDDEGDEVLRANLTNLDAFTGRPLPGDEIISAIPVCAPWSALSTYKYKAKIQPGSTKRGKAVKEVLTIWDHAGKDAKATDSLNQDVERIWPREIELIRGWKDIEVVGVVPVSKVRVMVAGGRRGADNAKGKGSKTARGGRGSKKK